MTAIMGIQPNASVLKRLTYSRIGSKYVRIEAQLVFHQISYVFPY